MDGSLLLFAIDPWSRCERVIGEAAEYDKDSGSDCLFPVPRSLGDVTGPFFHYSSNYQLS